MEQEYKDEELSSHTHTHSPSVDFSLSEELHLKGKFSLNVESRKENCLRGDSESFNYNCTISAVIGP